MSPDEYNRHATFGPMAGSATSVASSAALRLVAAPTSRLQRVQARRVLKIHKPTAAPRSGFWSGHHACLGIWIVQPTGQNKKAINLIAQRPRLTRINWAVQRTSALP